MLKPFQCPQCGASECTLIEDNRFHCNFCGSIFIYGNATKFQQEEIPVNTAYEGNELQDLPKKAAKKVGCAGVALMIFFAAVAVFIFKGTKTNATGDDSSISKKDYTEYNSQFTIVKTEKGTQIWTASTRTMNESKEESYYLNQLNPTEKKAFNSILLGKVTAENSSEKDAYKVSELKCFGNVCYATVGENKLVGYDVNTQEELVNNDLLSTNFSELKSGIAKIEDVYDLDGFKLTTKDGFKFYFIPAEKIKKNAETRTLGKLLTEKEYDSRNSKQTIDVEKVVTEYCFTKGERQQLYVIKRKTGMLFENKMTPSKLSDVINNDNIDNTWYRKSYKIISTEEFTPNKIYFNATVLYSDEDEILVLFQNEAGDNASSITLQCINADKTVRWTKTGDEITMFKKLIKSTNPAAIKNGNEIAIMQPYVAAIGIDSETGKINWTFKPY